MASNNTTFDICMGYESYHLVGTYIGFIANYIAAPIGFIIGVLVYSLSLIVYLKQVKKGEFAYVYQSLSCASEILTSTFIFLFVLTRYIFSGMYGRSVSWFVSCYCCMWYAAHLSMAIPDFFMTLTWMYSICMAFDRVFALYKPFIYRSINHMRHQICASVCSVLVAAYMGAFDAMQFYVQEDGKLFKVMDNLILMSGPGRVLGVFNSGVRVMITVALIAGNIGTVYLYRQKVSKKHEKLFNNANDKNGQTSNKKEAERTLTLLCICQVTFNTIDIFRMLITYILYYSNPNLFICGDVASYTADIVRWVCKIADFAFMMLVSKRFRQMFKESLPWPKNGSNSGVGPSQLEMAVK